MLKKGYQIQINF